MNTGSKLSDSNHSILKVAVNSPLHRVFDYLLPASLINKGVIRPGLRVRVPFGKREVLAFIVGTSNRSEIGTDKLKPITAIIDEEPVFDAGLLALFQWASRYYHFPLGQVLQTSLPKSVRQGAALQLPQESCWQCSGAEPALPVRAVWQRRVYELVSTQPMLSTRQISQLLNKPALPLLQALRDKQLLTEISRDAPTANLQRSQSADPPPALNSEQVAAVAAVLNKPDSYHCHLLEGITGSGKTEVYLQVMQDCLDRGKQVLVLVPEIGLTPQTINRFQQRFADRQLVAIHSGLSDGDRFVAWLLARRGSADLVIGTRSAIFTPLARPGLIIVDEEHDSSYKQQDGLRYSARDLAIYRARSLDIPIVLGTATPSLESLHNALSGRYQLLRLQQRAAAATLPTYRFIDLRGQQLREGFSEPVLAAIGSHLQAGRQVLVFINRRGFAPLLQCHDCGWNASCERCERSYTLHRQTPELRCHHCDSQRRLPPVCPHCKSSSLQAIGTGTERSEQVLRESFPQAPLLRIDRDTTRNRNGLEDMLAQIDSGQPCILVGTQMLAKGHHFPAVTLAVILDADSGLFSADFRGQEHMGQLLTQVAGRAGRGQHPGEVLVQTHHCEHPGLNTLIREGYESFARRLLPERKAARLPPFTHQILLRAEASQRQLPEAFLNRLSQAATQLAKPGTEVLGPMPASMEKRAGRFRYQLLLQAGQRKPLHELLAALLQQFADDPAARRVRWSVDVDPIDFT